MKKLYNISHSIEKSIDQCLVVGSSKIDVDDNTTIQSTWEEYDEDGNYDMVTIYIYENNVIKFRYQVKETKIDGYIPF